MMNFTPSIGSLVAAMLALGSLLGSPPAVAQKAALVQDRDSPARHPYRSQVLFNPDANVCPNTFYCLVPMQAVPAGQRLIVTYASAEWTNGVASINVAALHAGTDLFSDSVMLTPGVITASNRIYSAGPVSFHVDGPTTPGMRINGFSIVTSNSAYVTLVGYLVPLN